MSRYIFFLFSALIIFSFRIYGQQNEISLNWEIGYHKTATETPKRWAIATVPGAVQLDVMKDENYKQPYWFADNVIQFDWMEDYFFTYKTSFKKPSMKSFEKLYFHSKGIDYAFKILCNNVLIREQEGMFTYVDLDLTPFLKEDNELKIILMPVPKTGIVYEKGTETYRQNAKESVKPAVSYGWDWHPRLVTRGIWDETFLVVRNQSHIKDVSVSYILNEELTNVDLQVNIDGENLSGNNFRWILRNSQGETILEKKQTLLSDNVTFNASVPNPELWWPHDYGTPYLYTSELYVVDSKNKLLSEEIQKIGFRKIKLVMNDEAWIDPRFPRSRPEVPTAIEINNKRIFAKGSNWVHPEIFVGLISADLYERQLLLAKEANFNILRVWGGGIVNKESFFEICDREGILVWQEFPLACNNYGDDVEYLNVLKQEATSIINRVKKHPCLAIWSGGNELFWNGMTDQSLPLRLLNSLCYQLDPYTPYINTSPLFGMGHGHYLFYDKEIDENVFDWMPKTRKTAYTEFAVSGASNMSVLESFIPSEDLFPPKTNTAWEIHHGIGAWQQDSWLEIPTLKKYFGEIESLEELVKYSQLLQCEGLKFIYEEARRQRPHCSMALNWCFQEPWPSAANNSLINWPNEIKPAYYHVKNACRPVLLSVYVPKFEWNENEEFSCELYLLNDTYDQLEPTNVKILLQYDGDKEIELLTWNFPGGNSFQNVRGPKASINLPRINNNLFTVKVLVENHEEYNSSYVFLYNNKNVNKVFPAIEYYNGEFLFGYNEVF